jgi:hypothetical protein
LTDDGLLPEPVLFDITEVAGRHAAGTIKRVPLEHLELAPNKRRDISPESIRTLAAMLARTGQLVPCIGYRPRPEEPRVVLCAGQRRLLAARASHELAGTPEFEGLRPISSLIVLLLDHEPGEDEIRRIQAQENAREPLSLRDQQEQFRGLLAGARRPARRGPDGRRLRRPRHQPRQGPQPAAPAHAPAGGPRAGCRTAGRRSALGAHGAPPGRHAHVAPELTEAVAARISTGELHDRALRDLGGFVHRTVVEEECGYAVRIDDGALLDAREQIERARSQITSVQPRQAASVLGCQPAKLEVELDALDKAKALKLRVDWHLRDRAANGRYAWVFDRGRDFAAGIWVIDPVFMLGAVSEQLAEADDCIAREKACFAGARLRDDDMCDAADEDRTRIADAGARQA